MQVLDITLTVKSLYAQQIPGAYSAFAYKLYQFGDAFSESMDTQLFPFAIWAGIHFNQLLGRGAYAATPAAAGTTTAPRPPAPRRKRKAEKNTAAAKTVS
jgi:hypothetical protein